MIRIRLGEVLKGRKKTYYWLSKQTGIPYNTLWRLKAGRTNGISFDTLSRICDVLECQPGDVLVNEPGKKAKRKA